MSTPTHILLPAWLLLLSLLMPLAPLCPAQEEPEAPLEKPEAPQEEQEQKKKEPQYGYVGFSKLVDLDTYTILLKKLQLTDVKLENATMREVLLLIYGKAWKKTHGKPMQFRTEYIREEKCINITSASISAWDLLVEACEQSQHYFYLSSFAMIRRRDIFVSEVPQIEEFTWKVNPLFFEQVPEAKSRKINTAATTRYLESQGFTFHWCDPAYPEIKFYWSRGAWVHSDFYSQTLCVTHMPRTLEAIEKFLIEKNFLQRGSKTIAKMRHEDQTGPKPTGTAWWSTEEGSKFRPHAERRIGFLVSPDFFRGADLENGNDLENVLRKKGVAVPFDRLTRASYDEDSERFTFRGSPEQMAQVDKLVKQFNAEEMKRYSDKGTALIPAWADLEPGQRRCYRLLHQLQLPSVDLNEVSMEEALEFLEKEVRKARLGKFETEYRKLFPELPSPQNITIQAQNINGLEFLERLCQQTHTSYSMYGYSLTFYHDFGKHYKGMNHFTWQVSPELFDTGTFQLPGREFGSFNGKVSSQDALNFFKAANSDSKSDFNTIDFPEGAWLSYDDRTGILHVYHTSTFIREINRIIREYSMRIIKNKATKKERKRQKRRNRRH